MLIELNVNNTTITIPNSDKQLVKDICKAIKTWETRTYTQAVAPVTKVTQNELMIKNMELNDYKNKFIRHLER